MIGAMGAAAAASWAASLPYLARVGGRPLLPWPVVAAGLLGALLVTVNFSFRQGSASLNLYEIPLVVGVVFVSPLGLLLAVLVSDPLSGVVSGIPPYKSLFNTFTRSGCALAAVGVYVITLAGSSPPSLRGWAAGAAAVLASETISLAATLVALTVAAAQVPDRATVRSLVFAQAASVPLNAVLAVAAVTLIWANEWAGLLCVALGCLVAYANRSSTEMRRRYSNLQRLYEFTSSTSRVLELNKIIPSLLKQTREVMGAEVAELVLGDGDERPVRFRLAADERLVHIEPVTSPPAALTRLVDSGPGALLSRHDRRPDALRALGERNLREALAAPVTVGSDHGLLIVGNRPGPTGFDNEDLRLFETLAAHSSSAIASGRLLERLQAEAKARKHEALHDGLTGLANRTLFNQTLQEALTGRPIGHLVGIMLMDLDGFKEINDTLGHHTGDSILKEVATRLAEALPANGVVARLGGDEFAFVLPDVPDAGRIGEVANDVLAELGRPLPADGLLLTLRASLGVSIAPEHGEDRSVLMRRADVAMYMAKAAGGGMELYDSSSDHHTTRRLILATELSRALQEQAIEVWYQPQADLQSSHVVGCEALLRWNHPLHGAIGPSEFIPAAEQSGLIGQLTWWVLDAALKQVRKWRDHGWQLGVAVNISARTLLDADLVGRLSRLLDAAGVSPSWLTLELTESSIMADPSRSTRVLAALAHLGVHLAIDDFGTGYSSLTRLKSLPVHIVKIDKSFVMSMSVDEGDAAIVRSTIELARNLGHVVVAEGVEDQITWNALTELGCSRAQGYHLARAMPASAVEPWLRMRRRGHLSVVRDDLRQEGT